MVALSLKMALLYKREQTLEFARVQGRSILARELRVRRWLGFHGCGCTESGEGAAAADPGAAAGGGLPVVPANPACNLRESNAGEEGGGSFRFHIASLEPLWPENTPDNWEAAALRALEAGRTEVASVERLDGRPVMRLMLPVVMEKACLRCRSSRGTEGGAVRGGISIAVSLDDLAVIWRKHTVGVIAAHATYGLSVVLGLWGAFVLLRHSFRRRESAMTALQASEARLRRAERVAGIGHWELDLAGGVIRASEGAALIYGFDGCEWPLDRVQDAPLPRMWPRPPRS